MKNRILITTDPQNIATLEAQLAEASQAYVVAFNGWCGGIHGFRRVEHLHAAVKGLHAAIAARDTAKARIDK